MPLAENKNNSEYFPKNKNQNNWRKLLPDIELSYKQRQILEKNFGPNVAVAVPDNYADLPNNKGSLLALIQSGQIKLTGNKDEVDFEQNLLKVLGILVNCYNTKEAIMPNIILSKSQYAPEACATRLLSRHDRNENTKIVPIIQLDLNFIKTLIDFDTQNQSKLCLDKLASVVFHELTHLDRHFDDFEDKYDGFLISILEKEIEAEVTALQRMSDLGFDHRQTSNLRRELASDGFSATHGTDNFLGGAIETAKKITHLSSPANSTFIPIQLLDYNVGHLERIWLKLDSQLKAKQELMTKKNSNSWLQTTLNKDNSIKTWLRTSITILKEDIAQIPLSLLFKIKPLLESVINELPYSIKKDSYIRHNSAAEFVPDVLKIFEIIENKFKLYESKKFNSLNTKTNIKTSHTNKYAAFKTNAFYATLPNRGTSQPVGNNLKAKLFEAFVDQNSSDKSPNLAKLVEEMIEYDLLSPSGYGQSIYKEGLIKLFISDLVANSNYKFSIEKDDTSHHRLNLSTTQLISILDPNCNGYIYVFEKVLSNAVINDSSSNSEEVFKNNFEQIINSLSQYPEVKDQVLDLIQTRYNLLINGVEVITPELLYQMFCKVHKQISNRHAPENSQLSTFIKYIQNSEPALILEFLAILNVKFLGQSRSQGFKNSYIEQLLILSDVIQHGILEEAIIASLVKQAEFKKLWLEKLGVTFKEIEIETIFFNGFGSLCKDLPIVISLLSSDTEEQLLSRIELMPRIKQLLEIEKETFKKRVDLLTLDQVWRAKPNKEQIDFYCNSASIEFTNYYYQKLNNIFTGYQFKDFDSYSCFIQYIINVYSHESKDGNWPAAHAKGVDILTRLTDNLIANSSLTFGAKVSLVELASNYTSSYQKLQLSNQASNLEEYEQSKKIIHANTLIPTLEINALNILLGRKNTLKNVVQIVTDPQEAIDSLYLNYTCDYYNVKAGQDILLKSPEIVIQELKCSSVELIRVYLHAKILSSPKEVTPEFRKNIAIILIKSLIIKEVWLKQLIEISLGSASPEILAETLASLLAPRLFKDNAKFVPLNKNQFVQTVMNYDSGYDINALVSSAELQKLDLDTVFAKIQEGGISSGSEYYAYKDDLIRMIESQNESTQLNKNQTDQPEIEQEPGKGLIKLIQTAQEYGGVIVRLLQIIYQLVPVEDKEVKQALSQVLDKNPGVVPVVFWNNVDKWVKADLNYAWLKDIQLDKGLGNGSLFTTYKVLNEDSKPEVLQIVTPNIVQFSDDHKILIIKVLTEFLKLNKNQFPNAEIILDLVDTAYKWVKQDVYDPKAVDNLNKFRSQHPTIRVVDNYEQINLPGSNTEPVLIRQSLVAGETLSSILNPEQTVSVNNLDRRKLALQKYNNLCKEMLFNYQVSQGDKMMQLSDPHSGNFILTPVYELVAIDTRMMLEFDMTEIKIFQDMYRYFAETNKSVNGVSLLNELLDAIIKKQGTTFKLASKDLILSALNHDWLELIKLSRSGSQELLISHSMTIFNKTLNRFKLKMPLEYFLQIRNIAYFSKMKALENSPGS